MRYLFSFVSICVLLHSVGCRSHNYAQRGSAIGGLGGAGLGAAIGEMVADEPLAGAAIGTAVGALSGAAVGSGLDEVDRVNRMRSAAYAQPIGTNLDEVISMSNSGLGDEIIVRHIRNHGFERVLDAGDLIALRQQGVTDRVIEVLQERGAPRVDPRLAQAGYNSPVIEERIIQPPRVIIEERYHPMPLPLPRRRPRRPPPYRRHPGVNWGISFSN